MSKIGVEVKKQAMTSTATSIATNTSPEGFFNIATGEYKLPAGSIVDLSTVNIVPPPTNAVFDKNSGTYVVPETFGKIDKSTGEYKAPTGLAMGIDGQFKVVDNVAYQKAQAPSAEDKKSDRAPASEGSTSTTPAAIAPPNVFAGRPEMVAFVTTNAPVISTAAKEAAKVLAPVGAGSTMQIIAEEQKKKTEILRKTAAETGTSSPSASRVKFIFNAE